MFERTGIKRDGEKPKYTITLQRKGSCGETWIPIVWKYIKEEDIFCALTFSDMGNRVCEELSVFVYVGHNKERIL